MMPLHQLLSFCTPNPPYPYQWYGEPFKYYGNSNNIAAILSFLSSYYQLKGEQRFLDLAIEMAEELFAWQDYKHNLDPWQESGATNGNWDGSWYWYIYSPDPLPPGGEPNQGTRNGNAADRRIGYHTIVQDGLVKLASSIEQQRLLV